jgi:plasmid stability protein
MKAVTLRNLPLELVKTIHRRAKQKQTSVNKAVISLLEESLDTKKRKKVSAVYHDLDALAGSWSQAEVKAFERALA